MTMMHKKELRPQAWWFDSHNRAKPSSPWLSTTLSELDGKTKQMLELIDQDADSFAQRAEMYYKKRPVLVDMLGDLYRTHRSLAEQCDQLLNKLKKHGGGSGTRRRAVFAPSSSSCSGSSAYDSESEVDDPVVEQQQEDYEYGQVADAPESSSQQQQEQEQLRAEIERLKAENAALRSVADEKAEQLAARDEEKREAIRQLASSFATLREENRTLRRDRVKGSSSASRARAFDFDLRKVAKGLFSARRLFNAHCRPTTGPIVAL